MKCTQGKWNKTNVRVFLCVSVWLPKPQSYPQRAQLARVLTDNPNTHHTVFFMSNNNLYSQGTWKNRLLERVVHKSVS